MGSTFSGIEISKSGLSLHQTALNITGHNIANADDPNYARQRIEPTSMDPIYMPSLNRASGAGQLGQGARIAAVQRIRDSYYDDQIVVAQNAKHDWEVRERYLTQIEHILNEPSDSNLRTLHEKFWSSWQELANFPAERAHREVVLERAQALVSGVQQTHQKLRSLQDRADLQVISDVDQLNSLAAEIRGLNEQILKLQGLGEHPNDLMDRRDQAIEELSSLVNIRIGRGDKDELIVFIGEQALVQGEVHRRLAARPAVDKNGLHRIYWEHNDREVDFKQGRLYGLLEMRDSSIQERIFAVNSYVSNLADTLNRAHRDGFGLNASTNLDFFELKPLAPNASDIAFTPYNIADYDLNNDGEAEVTAIFSVRGQNTVEAQQPLGIAGSLRLGNSSRQESQTTIDYRRTDSMEDVIERINDADTGVVAYLDHGQRLVLKATDSESAADTDLSRQFMIRHLEDSGELLVAYAGILNGSGPDAAFDYAQAGALSQLRVPSQDIGLTPLYHPAAHLKVSDAITQDISNIAAAGAKDEDGIGELTLSNGKLDGSMALKIASNLKQGRTMIGHSETFEDFNARLIAQLGTESRAAKDALERYRKDIVELTSLRQSVMGVNLDEEMSNMIQFQHAYNASARMLQTQNEILEHLIMRLG